MSGISVSGFRYRCPIFAFLSIVFIGFHLPTHTTNNAHEGLQNPDDVFSIIYLEYEHFFCVDIINEELANNMYFKFDEI